MNERITQREYMKEFWLRNKEEVLKIRKITHAYKKFLLWYNSLNFDGTQTYKECYYMNDIDNINPPDLGEYTKFDDLPSLEKYMLDKNLDSFKLKFLGYKSRQHLYSIVNNIFNVTDDLSCVIKELRTSELYVAFDYNSFSNDLYHIEIDKQIICNVTSPIKYDPIPDGIFRTYIRKMGYKNGGEPKKEKTEEEKQLKKERREQLREQKAGKRKMSKYAGTQKNVRKYVPKSQIRNESKEQENNISQKCDEDIPLYKQKIQEKRQNKKQFKKDERIRKYTKKVVKVDIPLKK